MQERAWTALRVEVPFDAADLVSCFLIEEGAPGVVVDEVDEAGDGIPAGLVRLEAHVPAPAARALAAALAGYLRELRAVIASLGEVPIALHPVPAADWEATFAMHHRATAVGARLVIAPPWDVPSSGERIVVVVEPGRAFGTGQHGTTRGCLEEIEAAAADGLQSGLDVGTGSGVLAVAMRRLGMRPVVAIDLDRDVLPLARATCVANGTADVALAGGRADAIGGRFDLVVANLLADALVAEAAALAARVASGGRLVLSGLLAEQVADVVRCHPGWRVAKVVPHEEWRTLRLERVA